MSKDISYKFILIKSLLGDDSYLDIAGGKTHPGTPVITWSRHGNKNQVWYYDTHNSSIRSKLNDFCLEFSSDQNQLVVNPLNPHNSNQKWQLHLPKIRLQANPRLNLSVLENNSNKGIKVCALPEEGNSTGQQWMFEETGESAPPPPGYNPTVANIGGAFGGGATKMEFERREFLIVSAMDDDLVLDIRGDNADAGASLIMYSINRKKNQLWYVGKDGAIRSALNDMTFEGSSKGKSIEMTPFRGDPKHTWRIEGRQIVNGEGYCLDIRGGKGKKGDELCAYTYNGHDNQHWRLLY